MNLATCRSAFFSAFLALISSIVAAEEVMHGSVAAAINQHDNLIIAIDRFVGPAQPEDGIADAIFVFAAANDAAFGPLISALSGATSRLNIDYNRDAEKAVLKINVPATANYWLVVDAISDGAETQEARPAGSPTMLAGLAMSRLDVTAKAWTMDDAIANFRDFDILGPDPDVGEASDSGRSSASCLSGGFCSSSCQIQLVELSCSVTCVLNRYSCCSWNGCRCIPKSGGSDPY
ncbi:MAG: hypothetical protein ACNA8J_03740 [Gammaproteobacteria bacterium]